VTHKKKNDWMPIFLEALRTTGNVTIAAGRAKIGRATAYAHKDRDAKFAAEWDEAADQAADMLEAVAWQRAMKGTDEPVYYKGKVVGTVKRYSDSLIMFLLKANRPEKYRDVNSRQIAEEIGRRMGIEAPAVKPPS
jgi:hypothetical protein